MPEELTPDLRAFAKGLVLWAAASGADAKDYALSRAASFRDHGDADGCTAWLRVAAAIDRLRAGMPDP